MSRLPFSVIALLAVAIPTPSLAQYMYLDSNGDGAHTAADSFHGIGTTQIDIWLRTDHNRDGSVVVCPTGEAMTINSYTVILRATGGTVSWSNPTNLQALFGNPSGINGSDTEFHLGYFGAVILPAGTYHLARITAAPASGTPSIEIVPNATTLNGTYYLTSFGSACVGRDFDNTQKLGSDWFDVDGLLYSTGGSANSAPVLSALGALIVPVGTLASADFTISDPDRDALSVELGSGPSFIKVTELTSGNGTLAGRIHVWPRRGDEGSYEASIGASDGLHQVSAPFQVTVTPSPNHIPAVASVGRIDVVASTVLQKLLEASDVDGDALTFTKLAGPGFAEVRAAAGGRGASRAYLTLRPSLCDIGSSTVTIGLSDGYGGGTSLSIPIRVLASRTASDGVRTFPAGEQIADVAVADFNEDGHIDAVTGGEYQQDVLIFRGDGTGNLVVGAPILTGASTVAVAAGDWNHDGHADLAISAWSYGTLRILSGRGDGTFEEPVSIPDLQGSTNLAVGDLNLDGIDDLVVTGEIDRVQVLIGHEGSGLAPGIGLPMASASKGVAMGDFDNDGVLDLAVTMSRAPASLTVFFGRGDGTFGGRRADTSLSYGFYPVVSGDWNLDGNLDLAATQFLANGTYAALGHGDGVFSFSSVAPKPSLSLDMAAVDWDSDGDTDLIVAADGAEAPLLVGNGNGSFTTGGLGFPCQRGVAIADLNEDGRPDALCVSGGYELAVLLNPNTALTGTLARAFLSESKTIAAVPSSKSLCLRLEPQNSSFAVSEVEPSSVRLASEGTGSISSIASTSSSPTGFTDTDHNDVVEYSACFAMTDVARLFDGIRGRRDVTAQLQGLLVSGERFCAPVTMTVVGGGGALAARVEPNPMNPRGTLRFAVERPGPVTIRVFDLRGRLVRTLWDRHEIEPGIQEVALDGMDMAGRPIATGVYFFRIESEGERSTGRFTIMR